MHCLYFHLLFLVFLWHFYQILCLLKNNHQAVATLLMAPAVFLVLVQKKYCLGVVSFGGKEGWKKLVLALVIVEVLMVKKLLLLLLLLLLYLLLLLLFLELKYIRFSYNAFNLLCISISIVFGAFFVSVLATSFLT